MVIRWRSVDVPITVVLDPSSIHQIKNNNKKINVVKIGPFWVHACNGQHLKCLSYIVVKTARNLNCSKAVILLLFIYSLLLLPLCVCVDFWSDPCFVMLFVVTCQMYQSSC